MINRLIALAVLSALVFAPAGCGEPKAPAPAESKATESAAPTKAQTASAASPGKIVFDKQCSYCHAPGDEHPGYMQLRATRGEKFAVLEQRDDLTADYVKYVVRHGLNAMPPFKPSAVTDEDLQALADYLTRADKAQP